MIKKQMVKAKKKATVPMVAKKSAVKIKRIKAASNWDQIEKSDSETVWILSEDMDNEIKAALS